MRCYTPQGIYHQNVELQKHNQQRELDDSRSAASHRDSEKHSSILDCDCGAGFTCMWLNHFTREEKVNDKRRLKADENQKRIFENCQKLGSKFTDINNARKDNLINKSVGAGFGNSIVEGMTGCPIQKVHKMKEKKREKLKKYLYQGKQSNGYEYNKYKMQSGNKVSIETTPDYHFDRVIGPQKEAFHGQLVDQIHQNSKRKQEEYMINIQEELRNQK